MLGTKYVLAIEDWQGAVSTDLCFRQGDVIEVTGKSGPWWQGTLDGQEGNFPDTYVLSFLPRAEHAKAAHPFAGVVSDREAVPELSFMLGERIAVKAKGQGEWWYGTLAIGDPPNPQTGLFPAQYVVPEGRPPPSPTPSAARDWVALEGFERSAAAVQWAVECGLDGPDYAGLPLQPPGESAARLHAMSPGTGRRPTPTPTFFEMLGVRPGLAGVSHLAG
jgi:hypothetical protein